MHSNNEDPDGGYSDSRLLEIEREAAERSWYEKAEDLPQHSDWIDCASYEPSECLSLEARGDMSGAGANLSSSSFSVVQSHTQPASAVPSSVDVSRAVLSAGQNLEVSKLKLPWEMGVWDQILGDSPSGFRFDDFYGGNFKRPLNTASDLSLIEPHAKIARSEKILKVTLGCRFSMAVVDRDPMHWKVERERELEACVEAWTRLIPTWDDGLDVVQQVCESSDHRWRISVVRDLLGSKAPSTLGKRHRAILKYCDYLADKARVFPGTETLCYSYLCFMRDSSVALSSRKAFIEGLTFCRFVLGVDQLAGIADSRRCHGSVRAPRLQDVKQASTLTVAELRKIHKVLDHGDDMWDRCFCGMVLLTTYGRARWTDICHTERLILDKDENGEVAFLECRIGIHKTQRAKQFKHQFLPVVAPAVGVVSGNWAAIFLQCREALGMGEPPDWPLFAAPDKQGEPTIRSLDTAEVGRWLRSILFDDPKPLQDRRVSSHSLKATCLSFAAKFGAGMDDRLQLGYHAGGESKMGLVYGRDGASGPLRVLEGILRAIREDRFRPDATRSGRFAGDGRIRGKFDVVEIKDEDFTADEGGAEEDAPIEGEEPEIANAEGANLQTETGEACGGHVTTDSSDSSSSAEEDRGPTRIINHDIPADCVNWLHRKSRVLHVAKKGYKQLFVCGRKIGSFHSLVEGQIPNSAERCRLCYKLIESWD